MIGDIYGKWYVIRFSHRNKRRELEWICKCECGTIRSVKGTNLRTGKSKSCGCVTNKNLKVKHYTHNLSKTKIYDTWTSMVYRCGNSNSPLFKNYGERGIKVCKAWLDDFMNFYNWAMENGYEEYLTIDRIDNDGNYEPNNCRWVDMKTQANNRRNTIILEYKNVTRSLSQWANILNISYSKMYHLYNKYDNLNIIINELE